MKIEPRGQYILVKRIKNASADQAAAGIPFYYGYNGEMDTFRVLGVDESIVMPGHLVVLDQAALRPTPVENRYLIKTKHILAYITDDAEKTPDPVDTEVQFA
jgi:hypothetical protein